MGINMQSIFWPHLVYVEAVEVYYGLWLGVRALRCGAWQLEADGHMRWQGYEIMGLFSGTSRHTAEHAGCDEAIRGPTGAWISRDGPSSGIIRAKHPENYIFKYINIDITIYIAHWPKNMQNKFKWMRKLITLWHKFVQKYSFFCISLY